jgi:molybdopterin synthase catalytic subunit
MICEITTEPLDAAPLVAAARTDEAGAVAVFHGVVRNHNLGRRVLYLEYDAYPPMAEKKMRAIADEVRARWPVTGIAMRHRIGRLEIGEASVIIAVASPHRADAIAACHYAIDRLKAIVPIWKKEVFEGGEEWLEGTAIDDESARACADAPAPHP